MRTASDAPDRAGHPDPQDSRINVFSALGAGRAALLAALIVVLVAAKALPVPHHFEIPAAYLPLHTALGIFAIVVSMLVFAAGWNASSRHSAGNIVLIACAFLAVGLLDIAHTLSYPGMPDFVTPNSPGKAIHFWLAARSVAGCALLAVAYLSWRPFSSSRTRGWMLVIALGATALVYWLALFHPDTLPLTFVPGQGPTTFKIGTEFALVASYALASGVFVIRLRSEPARHWRDLFAACCVIALSELFFMFHRDLTDIYTLLGNVYTVIGYALIYSALLVQRAEEPYLELRRSQLALQESQAQFQHLVELSSNWYWEQDAKFRFSFTAVGELIRNGLPPEALAVKRRQELPITHIYEAEWEQHRLILEQRRPFRDYIYQVIGERGELRWFSISGEPILDAAGDFKGYRCVGRDVTERKIAEAETWLSRERLQLALEGSNLALVDVDAANGKIYLSATWAAMLGNEPADTVTSFEELMKLTHPAESERIKKCYYDALTGCIPVYDIEHRVMTRSGEWKWIRSHGKVVARDDNGRVVRMAGTNADITERKQAEQRQEMEHIVTRVLAESESLAAAMPQIIRTICQTLGWDCGAHWELDEQQQLLRCTGTWSLPNATGPGEFMAQSSQLTFTPDQTGLIRRALASDQPVWISDVSSDPTFQRAARTASAGLHGALAFPVITAGQTIGVMEFFSRHVRQPDSVLIEATRSIGAQIGQFIRSQRMDDARRVSEARLSGVIQSAMHAVIMTDEDTNIVLFNPAAENIFGHAAADMIGTKIERLIPGRFHHDHHKYVAAFGASKTNMRRMSQRGTIVGLRANGEEFAGEASISHLTLDGRKFYTVILSDITERAKTEENLHLAATAIENAQEGIIITDASNRIVSVNPAFTRITGYPAEEVIGSSPNILNSGMQDKAFYQSMWTAINETGCWQGEIWDRRKSGELYCEWLSISAVKNTQGKIAHHTAIFTDITARKDAEQALRTANQHLEMLVQSSPLAIYTRDTDGLITSWNPATEKLYGWKAAEVLGRPLPALPESQHAESTRQRMQLLAGKSFVRHEVRRQRRDGSLIDVDVFVGALRDTAGNITGIISVVSDVTERKQAEVARAQLAAIVKSSHDAIVSRTFDGTIVSWNAGAERMFGYSASEAIGKPISFNTPPGRVRIFPKLTERILSGETLKPHETQRMTKDGRVVDVLSSVSPIKNDAGEIIGIASLFQDITALKQTEAARRESEERFHAAFEQAGVGMGLRDIDPHKPRWLRVNQKLCDILGYTSDELLQITTIDLTPPEERDVAIDYNQRLLRGEIKDYSREKRYVRKDGRIIWTNLTMSVVNNPNGRPTHIISVIEDITESKRAQEEIITLNAELEQRVMERTRQLEATNKELETFSYSVSHDLRAPLRGIDGFSKLLQKEYGDRLDTKGSDYLLRIHRATRRMGELIDDLLQLSRVSRHQLAPEKVDLSQLASSILAEFREREPQRAVATEIQEGIVVQGDPRLLRILLENLLGNAWKFTQKEPHPRIRFGTTEQDCKTVIWVGDNGAGFAMEYAHKLFGAFQRLHGATEFEGTGIGLATVQRIVALHGGRVWAEGAVGKGATFYLTL